MPPLGVASQVESLLTVKFLASTVVPFAGVPVYDDMVPVGVTEAGSGQPEGPVLAFLNCTKPLLEAVESVPFTAGPVTVPFSGSEKVLGPAAKLLNRKMLPTMAKNKTNIMTVFCSISTFAFLRIYINLEADVTIIPQNDYVICLPVGVVGPEIVGTTPAAIASDRITGSPS